MDLYAQERKTKTRRTSPEGNNILMINATEQKCYNTPHIQNKIQLDITVGLETQIQLYHPP